MNKIVSKRTIAPLVNEYVIEAEMAAQNAHPGQFVVLRVDEVSERIPFTICDVDKSKGTITILVQEVGYSTKKLAMKKEGEYIQDFLAPLGHPTDLSEFKNIVLVGGGIGSAVIFPQAKYLKSIGKAADVIMGARNKELLIYEDEFKANSNELFITTDDGSYVRKGFVTDVLNELISKKAYDCVFAVGPLPMMRAVCNLTKAHNIKTIISMNSIMVDGTGMCGCCRVTVNGKIKYACVHGPEFDGHSIDFDEAINRSGAYKEQEKAHACRLTGEEKKNGN